MNKEYKMEIDPAILKLLGPSLYTNIYYVLAELIANAWDSDAKNVYIIDNGNSIVVEDDGIGMSYENGGIRKYLSVAKETRSDNSQAITAGKRLKMGRKGIGKLSALAVSSDVRVMTISNGEKSGFVLSREVPSNGLLQPISEEKISFEKINSHGTSINMLNPEYKLNKGLEVIKRNLIKMFPVVSADFKIHIMKDGKSLTIDSFDNNIIKDLASIITIGDEYKKLITSFNPEVSERVSELKDERAEYKEIIQLVNKVGETKEFDLIIRGWVGAYKSTKGRKTDLLEFPDNFISLYSNGKMGEFNILPRIGKNKLSEVYVVGQLHIDLFEETALPDMALSNRQGYKEDDKRYEKVSLYAQKLLNEIIGMRKKWTSIKEKDNNDSERQKRKSIEEDFKGKVLKYMNDVTDEVSTSINTQLANGEANYEDVRSIVRKTLEKNQSLLGLKPRVDGNKKKILISHTSGTKRDVNLADTIYEMLIFNGVPKKDILYSSADDEVARLPEEDGIYDYLRDFFVNSISDKKMYVIYVTSFEMSKSWGAVVEVGASWITRMNHKIFNIEGFEPKLPLNVDVQWHQSKKIGTEEICLDEKSIDKFCQKIEAICDSLGYSKKTREENARKLKTLVVVQ